MNYRTLIFPFVISKVRHKIGWKMAKHLYFTEYLQYFRFFQCTKRNKTNMYLWIVFAMNIDNHSKPITYVSLLLSES